MIETPIELAVNQYINLHRAVSSKRTVEYYEDTLNMFADYAIEHGCIYISDFSQDGFLRYIQMLRNRGIKNTSVNTYTRGLRAFANSCLDNNYIAKSFCSAVKKLRDDSKQIFPLTAHQVTLIDEYFNYEYEDVPFPMMTTLEFRNYVIFHLMLDCGLRRQEVINLNIEDVQCVHCSCLTIHNSKYNKSRIVPLPEKLLNMIAFYRNNIGLDCRKGPLLLNKQGERITVDCIKKLFSSISKETNIHVHPHLLRHTFATSYISGGGNLEFLRIILGHSDYNITQRYLHVAAQCIISDISIYRLDKCFFKNYNNWRYE